MPAAEATFFGMRDGFGWVVDLAQIVGALGTVVAIGYAAVANRNAKRAETRSRDAAVHERRIEFELGLLKELGELNSTRRFKLLARLLRADLVPLTCAVVGLDSTPKARALVSDTRAGNAGVPVLDQLRVDIDDEIDAAVDRLLAERHGDGAERPTRWRQLWQRLDARRRS